MLFSLPLRKEGVYATAGYGFLVVIKGAPNVHAAKVFAKWFLGNEGHEIFARAMGEPTPCVDVTQWSQEFDVLAAKDRLTVEQFFRMENQSEERIYKARAPAAELAPRLFD